MEHVDRTARKAMVSGRGELRGGRRGTVMEREVELKAEK